MAKFPDYEEALRKLYSAAPDDFLTRRRELAAGLRVNDDAEAAADIGKRRKPTLAAWVVNQLVLHDETVLDRITELGDELRATQHALNASKLRELSAVRRKLVAGLTNDAFTLADRRQPPVGLRDDVRGTFDAAIADPAIASRLGQLQRAEQFAGFGFGEGAPPQLTLVRGGKSDDKRPREPAPKPKKPTAEQRRHERALEAAKEALANAGLRHDEAQERERDARDEIQRAEKHLAAAKQRLALSKRDYEAARTEVKQTKTAFREARQAFERLERESP